MKNFKKSEHHVGYRTGISNLTTYNCMNPDGTSLVMSNKEWVNPNQPDYQTENKHVVKSIVQMNRERVKQMKVEQAVEGKEYLLGNYWPIHRDFCMLRD